MQTTHLIALSLRILVIAARQTSLAASVILLLIAATSAPAADTFLKATVTGTVQTQVLITNTDGRIRTEQLNNQRIFQEFLVSPKDYELAFMFGSPNGLVLVPKHVSAMLPTLTVAGLG